MRLSIILLVIMPFVAQAQNNYHMTSLETESACYRTSDEHLNEHGIQYNLCMASPSYYGSGDYYSDKRLTGTVFIKVTAPNVSEVGFKSTYQFQSVPFRFNVSKPLSDGNVHYIKVGEYNKIREQIKQNGHLTVYMHYRLQDSPGQRRSKALRLTK